MPTLYQYITFVLVALSVLLGGITNAQHDDQHFFKTANSLADDTIKIKETIAEIQKLSYNDSQKALNSIEILLGFPFFQNENKWRSKALYIAAYTALAQEMEVKGLKYAAEHISLAKNLNNSIELFQIYRRLSLYYRDLQNYPLAISYADSALYTATASNELVSLVNANILFGNLYARLDEMSLALGYQLKAFKLVKNPSRKAAICTNLGSIYRSLNRLDSAILITKIGLSIAQKHKLESQFIRLTNNLGTIYFNTKNYEEAKAIFLSSLRKQHLSFLSSRDKQTVFKNLAKIYLAQGSADSSLYYLGQVDTLLRQTTFNQHSIKLYERIAETYNSTGNHQKAYQYLIQSSVLKDSLHLIETKRALTDSRIKYDMLSKEKQIQDQELTITKQKIDKRIIALSGISLLLLSFIGYLIFRNHSRQKHRQLELDVEKQRLESDKLKEIDQLKTNFFANISHELRTPLTLILGPLTSLLERPINDRQHNYLTLMHRNADRLLQLVNNLLDLAKLDQQKMYITTQKEDLVPIIRRVVYSFQSAFEQKNVSLNMSLYKELFVDVEASKIETIISNLMSNAIRHSPQGSRIEVNMHHKDHDMMIDFIDYGPGVTLELKDKIFDRFYTGNNTGQDLSTGIGLSLSRQLAQLHGGNLTLNESLEGASFSLHLPLKEIPTNIVSTQSAIDSNSIIESEKELLLADGDERKILLLIDDNADVRNFIDDELNDEYSIIHAENGQEGLEKSILYVPDLVVVDVMMPIMTGTEYCKKLRKDKRTSHIPVIMLTAKASSEAIYDGIESGADTYIMKPFNSGELKLRIRKLIERREALRSKFRDDQILVVADIAVTNQDEVFLKEVVACVEANLTNSDFNPEKLHQLLFISRAQLQRKLKALTGKSPSSFIRSMRLLRAHQMISDGVRNFSDLAYDLGFNSLSYFSKSFKDQFGYSPSSAIDKKIR